MNFQALLKRVQNLITKPAAEWDAIRGETISNADLVVKNAAILAAVPAIASFIGFALIGVSYGFGTFRWPAGNALMWAIFYYVFMVAGVVGLGFIIDALAPNFGSTKDLNASFKVAVFAYFPAWLGGILFIIPSLSVLMWIVSLYSLFLLYLGIQKLKNPPADKLMVYFIVSVVVMAVIFYLAYLLSNTIAVGRPMMPRL